MKTLTFIAPWAFLAIVLLCIILASCSSFSTLQAIVDATAAAVPILEAAGVPVPPQVITYVADVANCIGGVTGTPSPAQLAAITACLASQVEPTLPPGLAQEIATVVNAVAVAVEKFIAQQKSTAAPKSFNMAQASKMQELRDQAIGVVERCRKIRAKAP